MTTTTPPTTFASVQTLLAKKLDGYHRRPQQEKLAEAIERTFGDGPSNGLLAQAGTGTGKSLGAMIPAILASKKADGRRYIVATSTIALMNQYCVAPETRVLTADLRYVPAGAVVEGMELFGFDEERGDSSRRRYKRATVESTEIIQRPSYRLTFDDGTQIVASAEHKWLVRRGPNIKWMQTEDLCVEAGKRPGSRVIRLFDTWDTDTSYEAGYLAAAFDGEGSLHQSKSKQVANGVKNVMTFAQKQNPMNKQVLDCLIEKGFDVSSSNDRGDVWYTTLSTRKDIVRFLGQIRPSRLLSKFDVESLGSINMEDGTRLVKKEFIGTQDVVAMKTTTGTFIAEGLASHNCNKDLPFLEKTLGEEGVRFTWAPLKGLSNFLCLAKINENPQVEHLDALLEEIKPDEQGAYTHTGDKDAVQTPLDQRIEWPLVSSTSDECPGKKKCAMAEKCFGLRHKAEAMDANIVVTNTAILMTDVKLNKQIRESSENGAGMHVLLGDYDGLIIDEAHELQETATNHLGFDIKQGGLSKFLDQAVTFLNLQGGADVGAQEMQDRALNRMDKVGVIIAEALGKEDKVALDTAFIEKHFDLFGNLYNDLEQVVTAIVRTKIERGSKEKHGDTKNRLTNLGENYLAHIQEVLAADPDKIVRWAEIYGRTKQGGGREAQWMIKTAPIEVGPYLREELWSEVPYVLMSATLSAGTGATRFNYITRSLGTEGAETLDVGSPFDYPNQALLYVPDASVPAPAGNTREEWETWVPEATLELVRKAKGGAMLLYTSRRAMNTAYASIGSRLEAQGYNCFIQGADLTNKEIASRFRDDEDSVLFGLRSFMTGMDFPGRTARLVVVDKLPFAVPSDPINKARENAIKKRGGQPFYDLAVPSMTLTLEQAFGRLIRSVTDWGVVAILDSRLSSKAYGKGIVKALPNAPATTSIADVQTFFDAWENAPAAKKAA